MIARSINSTAVRSLTTIFGERHRCNQVMLRSSAENPAVDAQFTIGHNLAWNQRVTLEPGESVTLNVPSTDDIYVAVAHLLVTLDILVLP